MASKKKHKHPKQRVVDAANVSPSVIPNLAELVDAAGIGIVRIVAAVEKGVVELERIANALERQPVGKASKGKVAP